MYDALFEWAVNEECGFWEIYGRGILTETLSIEVEDSNLKIFKNSSRVKMLTSKLRIYIRVTQPQDTPS